MKKRTFSTLLFVIVPLVFIMVLVVALGVQKASAQMPFSPSTPGSPLHPTFTLLDANGRPVLDSGAPLSTMRTCGQCHDTAFIEQHSFHADLGLSDYAEGSQTWNASPGAFGKWEPLIYRYLSQKGDERLDLSTAEWIMTLGLRHVGGGPATISRTGVPLTELPPRADDPETSVLDAQTGQPRPWDWKQSGTIEMNCFLCHLARPNNHARIEAIQRGEFAWANTATLLGSGIVEKTLQGWLWNPQAFDAEGHLRSELLAIQDPTNENCALCHGVVHDEIEVPLVLEPCTWESGTTGQVISPQRIARSGINIADKEEIARSWDIHAERQLQCTDCHFSLNNPVYSQQTADSRPQHLLFDPRRLEIGEYLQKPSHQFARGQSAQYTVAPELRGTMRRCESCHDANKSHANWLPYIDRHMQVLACESCHVPKMYAPAIQIYDWTVLNQNRQPQTACRGIETQPGSTLLASQAFPASIKSVVNLVTGFEPVLMLRRNVDGDTLLAPYNLITFWFWVYDDAHGNPRPVRLFDLQRAWFEGDHYAPQVLQAFDQDGDARLNESELKIDSPQKQAIIAGRLQALGLRNPRIVGQIQPYSISHNVTRGEWAIHDCQTCHSENSRLTQPFQLADYVPAGVIPEFVSDANVIPGGELVVKDSALYYQPVTTEQSLYIFGRDRVGWIDALGALFFVAVLFGVAGHGSLRFFLALRRPKPTSELRRVYMYQAYERFWHWLQTVVIVLLLFSGLVIHRPDLFGFISFRGVVVVHNVLAAILALNAALSLFYHLASGEIRQFIPRPYGFFDQAILQAKYYVQGIFKGAPHPFEKSPRRKLNPLQQATYFAILNVLLPLQGITGVMMWGAQKWPHLAERLGGLPFLAPLHTLTAWLFAAFIVGHVYLTTTGHEPLSSIWAMVTGWDEVEVGTENGHATLEEQEV